MEAWRDELYHYGIKGQKWGIRRWQNEDGTFNEAGKKRYFTKDITKELNKNERIMARQKSRLATAVGRRDRALTKDNTKKADKQQAKIEKLRKKIADGESRTKDLIKLAESKGYTINSRETTRYAGLGKKVVGSVLLPPVSFVFVGDLVKGSRYGKEAGGLVKGQKYAVTNNNYDKEKYN